MFATLKSIHRSTGLREISEKISKFATINFFFHKSTDSLVGEEISGEPEISSATSEPVTG